MSPVGATGDILLGQLLAQTEGRSLDIVTIRALVEEASQSGAQRALASLGLDDAQARRDMGELRELLSAWRDAKRSAWQAMVTWIVRVCLAGLLISIAFRLGLSELVHAGS
ncbi:MULTISPECIES: DUF6127 family protein [Sphingomonas]|uniref:DUF6127 family protein n=1 Tax=Sphingomonas TaxID=13687 RepID=UPI000DEF2B9B|nr:MULTISPECIES: DUF6127 family protein [Sphingomonas]